MSQVLPAGRCHPRACTILLVASLLACLAALGRSVSTISTRQHQQQQQPEERAAGSAQVSRPTKAAPQCPVCDCSAACGGSAKVTSPPEDSAGVKQHAPQGQRHEQEEEQQQQQQQQLRHLAQAAVHSSSSSSSSSNSSSSAAKRGGVGAGLSSPPAFNVTAAAVRTWARGQVPYRICTSPWQPMVACNAGGNPASFSGYQVELFRLLAQDQGWHDSDWEFACLPYTDMMSDLLSPTGTCTLTAAGVVANTAYLSKGLKYSWPTYKSGLSVAVTGHTQVGATWAFAAAFHWSVWLCLAGTTLVVGLLLAVLEAAHNNWQWPDWHGLSDWVWYSSTIVVEMDNDVDDPASQATRVLVITYAFLVLILMNMYVAFSAAQIFRIQLVTSGGIASYQDLGGKKVLTWSDYVPLLKEYNISATGHPWEDDADTASMLELLLGGSYDALVLDTPVLQHQVGRDTRCRLFLVGPTFAAFSLALAFPVTGDAALIQSLSTSMVRKQTQQGALDLLEDIHISRAGGNNKCLQSGGGADTGSSFTLDQVAGLYYILLISTGLMGVLLAAHWLRKQPGGITAVWRRLVGGASVVPQASEG